MRPEACSLLSTSFSSLPLYHYSPDTSIRARRAVQPRGRGPSPGSPHSPCLRWGREAAAIHRSRCVFRASSCLLHSLKSGRLFCCLLDTSVLREFHFRDMTYRVGCVTNVKSHLQSERRRRFSFKIKTFFLNVLRKHIFES